MTWNTPRSAGLQYCAKVGIAAFFGYLLCVGDRQQYGIYSAFTAALIVGTSVGEDLGTAGNRVRGTLAGMAAGLAVAAAFGMSAFTLAAGVALTAFIATGFGWGVPAARIGATVCAIIIAPTRINAGAVAAAGITPSHGATNSASRKQIPATIAVTPDRPPAATPAALSI